ncbi:hypothetical protein [Flavobacterium denitrificans]|uniref:hypothetical protein n=1 Tax=Flavobacterium denitrificans TaxID=281361 RepID=UPI0004275CE7|nr:hypothetical protein [Flavobacterium denitrificans]
MTKEEEKSIDSHIWNSRESAYTTLWTMLDKNKYYYDLSLVGLVTYGNMLCNIFGKDDVVGFTRILHHIGLEFEFVKSGIQLKENAKVLYKENRMNPKPHEVKYNYDKKTLRVGKEDRYENKIGWAEQILLNNKKDQDKKNEQ